MFKARWRSDRSKSKALFKLRLEVVQVPRSGWESLVVSLVPLDVGRPSARSERAPVVEGTCTWGRAVFENVKLSRDPKTGRIHEKVYRFLVSGNELPKGRLLGEATFDFADYAESIKPSMVSLQLKGSNCSAVLHITVQRMQEDANVNGRDNEDNGADQQQLTSDDRLSNVDNAEADQASNGNNGRRDDLVLNGQSQLRFHSTRTMVMHVEQSENIARSQSFQASSAICSEVGSERNTPVDVRSRNTRSEKAPHGFLSPLRKTASNSSDVIAANGDRWGSNTEWSLSSAPDESLDGSTNSSEDIGLRERLQEPESLEKLRNDVVSLSRQVEVSELELQALRKQVVKERRHGEDLSKEVCALKEEKDLLKRKYELLNASRYDTGKEIASSPRNGEDLSSILEETKHELRHEKNLNATLSLQLQMVQDSNSELVLAVKDLEELLDRKKRETPCPNCQQGSRESRELPSPDDDNTNVAFVGTNSEHEEDEELQVLAMERDDTAMSFSLSQRIEDLTAEIELYKKDREDLEMQMEQLALDFEIVKQEHHDISTKYEQSQLREQLRMQYECSAHLSVINDLEVQVENLEKELERQEEMFEEDLESITRAKIEQEQRAIRAEEALQKSKWNNIATTERLQGEFRTLSLQMSTLFASNEKTAMRAITEASDLRMQKSHLQRLLDEAREEFASVKNQFKIQLKELLDQVDLKSNDADELQLKLKNKSDELESERRSRQTTEKALLQEISKLKSEADKLSSEKFELSKKIDGEMKLISEIENLKIVIEEMEMHVQDRTRERDALAEQLDIVLNESKKSKEEQYKLQLLIKDNESNIRNLKSDLASLKAQYNGLTKSFVESQMEKENLRAQLKHSTHRRSSVEEDSKTTNVGNVPRPDVIESLGVDTIARSSSVSSEGKADELLREVEALKETNRSMEDELKEMQERYSELSLKFAEVEGERQHLIMRVRTLKNMMKNHSTA